MPSVLRLYEPRAVETTLPYIANKKTSRIVRCAYNISASRKAYVLIRYLTVHATSRNPVLPHRACFTLSTHSIRHRIHASGPPFIRRKGNAMAQTPREPTKQQTQAASESNELVNTTRPTAKVHTLAGLIHGATGERDHRTGSSALARRRNSAEPKRVSAMLKACNGESGNPKSSMKTSFPALPNWSTQTSGSRGSESSATAWDMGVSVTEFGPVCR